MEPNGYNRKERKREPFGRMNGNGGDVDAELDPWTAWAYRPRTISLLLIGACFLIWASGALDPESTTSDDLVTSVKRGVWAMIAVFLAYSLLQAPSTVLIRPHPALWRLVHGMAVIYLVALTFLLFQRRDDARQFMKFLHPDLGIELPERSYGADCRLYVPDHPTNRFKNLYDTIFDEFFLAHIFGWWGKAILIRNQPLLWVLSIGFELLEVGLCLFLPLCVSWFIASPVSPPVMCMFYVLQLTFRHMLPNFNECWWDSIVLDILICNWFGIWAGMYTVRYFDGKTYEWVGISRQPNIIGKVKRTLGQFTPAHWDKDEWHPLQGPWRFIQVLTLCIIFLTVELNTFFLKFSLWIPPRNPVILYRLILWWLIAIPTTREYNSYLQDRTSHLHQVWNWIVPSGNASVGSDAMGKCGTWACGLLDGLDMEDSEDTREKETLISSYIIVAAEVRQSNAIVGFVVSLRSRSPLQDRADEEVVDPKKYLEESCKPKCVKPLLEYQACVKRIQGDDSGHKHCTGQYFDYWHCIDKCVSSSYGFPFAVHIISFFLRYNTEMKLDFISPGCTQAFCETEMKTTRFWTQYLLEFASCYF
ncbi:hypothetical protein HID58_021567 [Brassica napus]|uniref:CDP-diacylglycerol--serine O-phosphatidyltransferase n=1 Tax=Brassica napus TaxID=3708 RepID=A0ABQ8CWT1_BRANA|nr:hypothetical protein HID58_021567 [Brassica napus]